MLTPTLRHDLVTRMLQMIRTDYAELVTLPKLAAALDRPPAALGSLFRREVGMTARECLTRVRLAHATELIQSGVKIEAVALIVGYRSKKNFYRQFRRHFQTTPKAYRRSLEMAGGVPPTQPPSPALHIPA